MMISLHKSLRILLLLSISGLLSSCNYRTLSQENKNLKDRKAQLTEDVDTLVLEMGDDTDDQLARMEITKAEAHLVRLKHEHQELTATVQKLKEQRDELEAAYDRQKQEYASKP